MMHSFLQLEYLSKAAEFSEIRFRAGEKSAFQDINKREDIKYPLKKISEPSDKVQLLLQVKALLLVLGYDDDGGNDDFSHRVFL